MIIIIIIFKIFSTKSRKPHVSKTVSLSDIKEQCGGYGGQNSLGFNVKEDKETANLGQKLLLSVKCK